MRGREIATGDIHGASASLALLLLKISPQPTDHIILLGDLIDYGPDSRGVLEQLMALSARTRVTLILGNHEERFLDCLVAMNQADTDPNPLAGWLTAFDTTNGIFHATNEQGAYRTYRRNNC